MPSPVHDCLSQQILSFTSDKAPSCQHYECIAPVRPIGVQICSRTNALATPVSGATARRLTAAAIIHCWPWLPCSMCAGIKLGRASLGAAACRACPLPARAPGLAVAAACAVVPVCKALSCWRHLATKAAQLSAEHHQVVHITPTALARATMAAYDGHDLLADGCRDAGDPVLRKVMQQTDCSRSHPYAECDGRLSVSWRCM